MQVAHAVIDLALVLRGASPNMNLGMTDNYIWAGEWGLAVEEMAELMAHRAGDVSDLADVMLTRAKAIVFDDQH